MKKIKFYFKNDEVYAVIGYEGNGKYLGYAHIGQHTTISQGYIDESRKLNKNNKLVTPLYNELKQIGY